MKKASGQAIRFKMRALRALAGGVLAGLMACGAAFAQSQPQISGAWVRGMVAGQSATGAFMAIDSSEPLTLIGARTPVAASAEVHEMAMEGTVMRMRPVSGVPIQPGQRLELRPGSYHLMFTGVKSALVGGESVPVQLEFQRPDGRRFSVEVKAEVRALAAPAPAAAGGHMHH